MSPDDLLWPEEVMEYLGWYSLDSPRQRAYQTRLRIRAGLPVRPIDFPLPVRTRIPREVPSTPPSNRPKSTQTTRIALQSQWRRGDLDAFRDADRRPWRAAALSGHRDPATGRASSRRAS